MKTKLTLALLTASLLAMLSTHGFSATMDELQAPPVPCTRIEVPEGNQVAHRAYATGVQVYAWNGTSWAFVGPIANLYADRNFHGKIGEHYGGPTWKSNSGSLVIGSRIDSCTVDPNSIPWLLLGAAETDGNGIFRDVTYIQRVNTVGGKAPSTPGNYDGEPVSIPYTAEYYFYKASKK